MSSVTKHNRLGSRRFRRSARGRARGRTTTTEPCESCGPIEEGGRGTAQGTGSKTGLGGAQAAARRREGHPGCADATVRREKGRNVVGRAGFGTRAMSLRCHPRRSRYARPKTRRAACRSARRVAVPWSIRFFCCCGQPRAELCSRHSPRKGYIWKSRSIDTAAPGHPPPEHHLGTWAAPSSRVGMAQRLNPSRPTACRKEKSRQ